MSGTILLYFLGTHIQFLFRWTQKAFRVNVKTYNCEFDRYMFDVNRII